MPVLKGTTYFLHSCLCIFSCCGLGFWCIEPSLLLSIMGLFFVRMNSANRFLSMWFCYNMDDFVYWIGFSLFPKRMSFLWLFCSVVSKRSLCVWFLASLNELGIGFCEFWANFCLSAYSGCELQVKRKIDLVYGGGSVGLMGLISQKVYDGGCHVLG